MPDEWEAEDERIRDLDCIAYDIYIAQTMEYARKRREAFAKAMRGIPERELCLLEPGSFEGCERFYS